jgi:hypothetical protein
MGERTKVRGQVNVFYDNHHTNSGQGLGGKKSLTNPFWLVSSS